MSLIVGPYGLEGVAEVVQIVLLVVDVRVSKPFDQILDHRAPTPHAHSAIHETFDFVGRGLIVLYCYGP